MFSSIPILVFSLVLKPLQLEMGWSREALALAPSLFYLVGGVAALLAGRFLDRMGARIVLVFLLSLTAVSCVLFHFVSQLWQLYLVYGFLFPASSGGVMFTVVPVILSAWFKDRRGATLGVVSTGFSFGQLLLVPAFSFVLLAYGWRFVLFPLAAILAFTAVLAAMVFRSVPPENPGLSRTVGREGLEEGAARTGMRQALGSSAFWLMAVSFFACGFTDYLIVTHLASFASDQGFFQQAGAYALAVMGGANILGLVVTGRTSDTFGPGPSLAFTYLVRLIAIPILLVTRDVYTLFVFAVLFGLTYSTTAPLTANMVRQIFGQERMGSVLGALSLVHSLAGVPGAYVGGLAYDLTGSYSIAFAAGFVILLAGTISAFVAAKRTATIRNLA
jgi:MFS family permease